MIVRSSDSDFFDFLGGLSGPQRCARSFSLNRYHRDVAGSFDKL